MGLLLQSVVAYMHNVSFSFPVKSQFNQFNTTRCADASLKMWTSWGQAFFTHVDSTWWAVAGTVSRRGGRALWEHQQKGRGRVLWNAQ